MSSHNSPGERGAAAYRYTDRLSADSALLFELLQGAGFHEVFEAIYKLLNIPVAIIDLDANVLFSSRWQRICVDYHRVHPATCARCVESDRAITASLAAGQEYAVVTCPTGLTDCAAPIVLEGRHAANFFIGQFLTETPDEARFRRQAREFGFPPEEYLAALRDVPVVDEGRIPAILELLSRFTRMVTELSMERKRAMENAERQRVILDALPQSVFWKDCEGRFAGCNAAFAREAGLSAPSGVIGKTDFDLPWSREEAEAYRADDRAVIESQRPRLHIIEPLHKADGTPTVVDTSKIPLRDAAGKPSGVVGIYQDVTERERAQQSLEMSEARFRAAFMVGSDGFVLVGLQDDVILEGNDRFLELYGYTRDEVIGRSSMELDLWADPEARRELLERLTAAGRVDRMEVLARRRNGETFPVLYSVSILKGAEPPVFIGAIHDITEERQAEENLRASIKEKESLLAGLREAERALRDRAALLDIASEAILVKDTENRITYWNKGAERLYGWTSEEALGMSDIELLHTESTAVEALAALVETHRCGEWHGDLHKKRRDGSSIVVSTHWNLVAGGEGLPPSILSVSSDVTLERSMQLALEDSEQKFSRAFLQSPDAVIISRYDDATLIDANEAFTRLTGYLREEVIGRSVFAPELGLWVSAEDRDSFVALLEQKGLAEQHGTRIRRKDGSLFFAVLSARLVDLGRQKCVVTTARDMTEWHRMDEALQESERKYRELVENANSIIMRWGRDGRVTFLNEFGLRFFGYTLEELAGRSLIGTIVPEVESSGRDLHRLMEDICADPGAFEQNVNENAKRSGERAWVSWTNKIVRDANGDVKELLSVGSDITGRRQVELALDRSNRHLRAISQCNQLLVRAEDERSLLPGICSIICESGGYRMAWVGYAEEGGAKRVRPVAWAGAEASYLASSTISWADDERGAGATGTSIRSGQTVCVQDFETDPRVAPWREDAMKRGYRSSLSCPLKDRKGRAFGALGIYSSEINAFTEEETRLLEQLASDLAFGIGVLRAREEQNKSERLLRESEEDYRNLFGNMVNGIMVVQVIFDDQGRPRDHVLVQANAAFDKLTGVAARNEIGRDSKGMTVKWPPEILDRLYGVALGGEPIEYDSFNESLGKHFETRVFSPKYGQFAHVFTDVTERNRMHQKLLESEARYREIFDNTLDGIFLLEVTEDHRYRMLDFNKAEERVFRHLGIDPASAVGKFNEEFLPAEYLPIVERQNRRCIEEGKPLTYEGVFDSPPRRLNYTTTIAPIRDASGRTIRIVGVTHDETQKRQDEEKLREQAAIIDVASDAVIVTGLDRRVALWNKAAERIYGWSAAEAASRSWPELVFPAEGLPRFEEALAATLERGEWRGDQNQVTRDQKKLVTEGRWTLLRDEQGRPKGILSVNSDVTSQRSLEAQLLRSQRLESLGTLAGGIAHDLNNVLAPILMGIEGLSFDTQDVRTRKMLEIMKASAQRGADIVRQILNFARGMEGSQGEVQLKHLLREIEGIIRETFPKSIELASTIPRDLQPVLGNATQLHQVLMNLCVNARDAMPSGGRLSLRAWNQTLDEVYSQMDVRAKPGDYVVLSVDDTGTGMTPEIIERIWDPFFTTKEIGKGTGLGLATVHTIIKNHGGFIKVYSEPGKGSSFRVYVPSSTQKPAAAGDSAEEAIPMGEGEVVLLVDDEVTLRDMTQQTLESCGYKVITAGDGTEAIAKYVEKKDEIRLVLTDMMMPYMDGPSTIRAIRKINPGVLVIASSGLTSKEQTVEIRGLGVQGFLGKPYTAEALLRTFREVLTGTGTAHPIEPGQ